MWEIILPSLMTILTAVFSYVGMRLKTIYEQHIQTKEKEIVIRNTVKYIEQVFGDLDGASKLEKAKATAIDWLNEKNVPISDAELTVLIESAVKALKGGFYFKIKEEEEGE